MVEARTQPCPSFRQGSCSSSTRSSTSDSPWRTDAKFPPLAPVPSINMWDVAPHRDTTYTRSVATTPRHPPRWPPGPQEALRCGSGRPDQLAASLVSAEGGAPTTPPLDEAKAKRKLTPG